MAILTEVFNRPSDPELTAFLNRVKSCLNNLDDANMVASAGINSSKVEDGELITAHASRHAHGGLDPLAASSVNGAMIQPRCVNGSHIGIGAILAEHLGFTDSASGLLYLDTSDQEAGDGDVISDVSGYTTTVPILMGYEVRSNSGKHLWYINVGFARVSNGWQVTAECQTDSDSGTVAVHYRRLAWK